ncbi:MAG: hypothetical protein RLY20_2875, partial [Verrucomicrobiota bacterium]
LGVGVNGMAAVVRMAGEHLAHVGSSAAPS